MVHCTSSQQQASTPVVETQDVTVTNEEDHFEISCKLWTATTSSRKNNDGVRSSTTPEAAALFLHGGMFSCNDKNSHAAVSQALVRDCSFNAVLTANFRDGSCTTFSTGKTLSDLKCLVRYMKTKFPKLPLGIIGSSSGGFFALQLCNALEKGDVQFCIPLAPVADPKARADYLQFCIKGENNNSHNHYYVQHTPEKAEYILKHQLQYFDNSWEQMSIAAELVQFNCHNIPTLVILGAADKNIPYQVTQNVQQNWATRTIVLGNPIGHELQNEPPTTWPPHNYIPDIQRFLQDILS